MSKELEKIIGTPIYTIGDEENKIIVFEDGGGFIYGNNAQKVINKLKALEIIKYYIDCSLFIKQLEKHCDDKTIDLLKEVLLWKRLQN